VTSFSVWAPNASSVDVVVSGRRHPMQGDESGWWRTDVDSEPGADYGFSLDGDEPLPDPRSGWQPAGVHGLSRLVDHGSFNWRTDSWELPDLLGTVIYELHIGTFTPQGTFDAAIDRLDHLVELGVGFVEILPVAAFPGDAGWGYDGVFPYAVQDSYGGPDGLKRFVDACHARGLGAILDVVYNHLGPDGNVLPTFGPYFTDSYATPWGQALNFSGPDSDDVRRYFLDNALMWLQEYRFDALRLDAVHAIVDTSATHLLEEMSADVASLSARLRRPMWLIAESDLNDPRIVARHDAGGYGVDAQWSDDFHHALHAVVTGESFGYYEDFGHDQVGNRARGERLAALTSPDLVKVAAALVLLSAFTPMLFMGEEWAASTPWQYFTDHRDPELAESVRHGRRNEFKAFGWDPSEVPDPQDPETARRSVLDWSEPDRDPHADVLAWHRSLIALRRSRPELSDGSFGEVEVDEAARTLVMRRGSLAVAANFSDRPATLSIKATRLLLSSSSASLVDGVLTLPGQSVAILDGETA
jgi:maltooligosyltrehalose trehalohydrolase